MNFKSFCFTRSYGQTPIGGYANEYPGWFGNNQFTLNNVVKSSYINEPYDVLNHATTTGCRQGKYSIKQHWIPGIETSCGQDPIANYQTCGTRDWEEVRIAMDKYPINGTDKAGTTIYMEKGDPNEPNDCYANSNPMGDYNLYTMYSEGSNVFIRLSSNADAC